MTIAKDSSTDEIIHGNDLRGMDDFYIKTTSFECPYEPCKIKATPCSFTMKHVNQSYFRYGDKHKDGCGIHDPRYKTIILQMTKENIIRHLLRLYHF